ncbi:unnamed protein product [Alternaria alternata]
MLEAGATWNAEGVDTESLLRAISFGPSEILAEMLRYGMPLQMSSLQQLEEGVCWDDGLTEDLLLSIDGVEDAKIPLDVRIRLLELAREKDVELKVINLPIDRTTSTMKAMSDEIYVEAIVYTAKYGLVSDLLHLTTDERFSVSMEGPCRPETLLHIAAEHNSPECMELLLDKGFDAAHLDEFGCTVLEYAITCGVEEEDLLRRLIQSNATEIVDNSGRGVWHFVAEEGRLDVFDILVAELGPDHPYLCMQSKLGRTPLLEAVLYRQSHIASRILRSLPADKALAIDPQVVYCVVATGLEDVLRQLVEMGASLHTRSDQGQSALYFITQETTPGILRTLLDHGHDVDHLDSYGKTPFLDFLEVDQHSQRLRALGYSESGSRSLNITVMELLATPFCATTQDKEGNSAWFCFCTKTMPHHLLRLASSTELGPLVSLSDVLIERGALKAYEEATTNSGIALLIKACVDTVLKTTKESQKVILPFFKAILRHVSKTTTVNSLFVTHRQAVRLLIWSMTQSDNGVFEQLLGLGVDVHATYEDYDGDSAIDVAIESTIGERLFDKILTHADPARIPKLDADGSMRHFVLCIPPSSTKEVVEDKKLTAATNISKLEAMLRRGVDPNAKSSNRRTAAHVAARKGYLECIETLVAYHADLTLVDDHGWNVIHESATKGRIIILKYLLQLFQQQEIWERCVKFSVPRSEVDDAYLGPLSQRQYHRATAAHLAVYRTSPETLQFLRDNNILDNINARTQEGATPLHFAVCTDSPQTTRWLLENGADVNAKCGKKDISALHVAFRLGRVENAIALIEAGAEFSADSAGITPEMQVDLGICADLLELLPSVGVSILPTVMEGIRLRLKMESSGSLYMAIVNGDLEASGLENLATDYDAVSVPQLKSGLTALHVAVMSNKPDAIDALLKHGVDVNVRDATGLTPLHYAADADNGILVEELLKAGAKLNAISNYQTTPLKTAARAGAMQAASMLVKYGADLAMVDFVGRTALHQAARKGNFEIFTFLIDAGCDPYQLDDKKHSPLYYALPQSQFATYIYARSLDLIHVVCADKAPKVGLGINDLRSFLCYSSEATRRSYLTMETEDGDTVLTDRAVFDGPDLIRVCIKAGAQLETTRNNGDTVLLAACRAGRLSSVAYLVRQGAKLEYEHRGRIFNAYAVACKHSEIIAWMLVGRWTEQRKLDSEPANSGGQVQCQPWTGVRTVKIPLCGDYERSEGSSLLDHAIYLHGVAKGGWKILVPLGWDTMAHLVSLPGEA